MYTLLDFDKVKKLSQSLVGNGCVIDRNGVIRPSKTGLFVHKYTPDILKFRNQQVKRLGKFFFNEWKDLLNKKIQGRYIKHWLGLDQRDVELVLKKNVLEGHTYYYGIDLSGPDFKITDFNSDRATVIGFQDEVCRSFSEYYFDYKFSSFYDTIMPLLRKISRKSNPRVFVLTYDDEAYCTPISNFCKKFGYKYGSIKDFSPSGVDIILRQVKSEEIIGNIKKYKKLLDCLDYLPMINPLSSYISGNKGWFTILSALGLVDRGWFPATWLINNDRILNSFGQSASFAELKSLFLDKVRYNNRKNYVVKNSFGAGGREVYIGEDMKRYEWEFLWRRIENSTHSWSVEEKLLRNNYEVLVGDWVTVQDEIEVINKKLNIIERVYSVYPFKSFSAEVFGKDSNKVNASGYTFPLAF